MLFSLCAATVDRRYVLSMRRDENDRSAEAVLAGTVFRSCNSFINSEKRVEVVFNSLISCREGETDSTISCTTAT